MSGTTKDYNGPSERRPRRRREPFPPPRRPWPKSDPDPEPRNQRQTLQDGSGGVRAVSGS